MKRMKKKRTNLGRESGSAQRDCCAPYNCQDISESWLVTLYCLLFTDTSLSLGYYTASSVYLALRWYRITGCGIVLLI